MKILEESDVEGICIKIKRKKMIFARMQKMSEKKKTNCNNASNIMYNYSVTKMERTLQCIKT